MRIERRAAAVLAAVVSLVALSVWPAGASPVCPDEPRAPCGGRVFPEAETTLTFVQHDNGEYEAGIKALARDFPRFVKVKKIDHYVGHPVESVEGRPIWIVEITDFDAPQRDKVPVIVSLAIHGFERAGLEGGVRYMEDLARWATDDPGHELRNGIEPDSVGLPVSRVLEEIHLYLAVPNPDGWAAGDIQNGGVYERGNGNGVDLNREFPTIGWSYPPYTPLSEPETKAWAEFAHVIDPVVTGDLHGELTSANNAFADIMLPAGQWNPLEQAREEQAARHMASNVNRYFQERGVEAAAVTDVAGMKGGEYATGYDVVGYDAAGFMGDWFTQEFGAVDIDVEHFMSHMVPNSTWVHALEEAHIMAVRAEIETLIVEAIALQGVGVRLNLGDVGYFEDPAVVTKADGYGGPPPPADVTPEPYRATRIQYFRDLTRFTTSPLRALHARDMTAGRIGGLETIVLADQPFGQELAGRESAERAAVASLKSFVRAGGNLVLTDRAVTLLPKLGVVARDAIHKRLYNAGHIDIHDFSDPYTKDVHTTASQTYYEVPLGFTIDQDASPHWVVDAAALADAGGKAIAHVEEESEIGLGRVKIGRGTIGFIGALLPQPTEKYDHFYGLADYAVSVAGGQILNNMMRFGR